MVSLTYLSRSTAQRAQPVTGRSGSTERANKCAYAGPKAPTPDTTNTNKGTKLKLAPEGAAAEPNQATRDVDVKLVLPAADANTLDGIHPGLTA